ncbi:MAG: glutamate--tRNA ligase [Alphaproteobacteria bacterium]|nr:glutamate--tRNA ligase [Alphaproteobacteria bacterium]
MSVVVRFAPSPTGLLHIGNIRAALFNYLFARKHGGVFMLRLDDTDRERSTEAFAKAIERDMAWLGLTWNAFARQSDRTARYRESLEKLKSVGRVYPCYETQGELDLKRKTQLGRGLPPVYDRSALKLSDKDRAELEAKGRRPHWRFKLDYDDVAWDDLVQGRKVLHPSAISDPVLVREDGVPLYTFCSVVDDIDDKTTHIVRGEDHVTNTAVQIQIWRALSQSPPPVFAHYPLLVSSEGIEMSKRLGTLSIASMRDELLIEPMAINSLLAKLGTSEPIAPRLSLDELADEFDFSKISHATPKFDLDELKTLNAKVLHLTPFESVKTRLAAFGVPESAESFWNAVRANLTTFADIRTWAQIVYGRIDPVISDAAFLAKAAEALPSAPWTEETWRVWTEALKGSSGRKGKELFMPLRLALTGVGHGPEMRALLPLIGETKVRARLVGTAA